MLAAFCLRLALGVVAFLPLLPGHRLHPRFFRTQFLTALGLAAVALASSCGDAAGPVRLVLAAAVGIALGGALAWSLDPAPLGHVTGVAATAILATAAVLTAGPQSSVSQNAQGPVVAADALAGGLFVGSALTAMLVGHSYLISPGLTIAPLMTMLAVLGGTLAVRVAVLAWGWTHVGRDDTAASLTAVFAAQAIYLVPRWLVGVVAPAVFGTMAYFAARIRSTQSATGILFVVVICAFLGELVGMIIVRTTGLPL
jgi:hypothetical protein